MKITEQLLDRIEQTTNMFYVVMKGKEVGIYPDWASAEEQVIGVAGQHHKKERNRDEAVKILKTALQERSKTETLSRDERETLESCEKIKLPEILIFPPII